MYTHTHTHAHTRNDRQTPFTKTHTHTGGNTNKYYHDYHQQGALSLVVSLTSALFSALIRPDFISLRSTFFTFGQHLRSIEMIIVNIQLDLFFR